MKPSSPKAARTSVKHLKMQLWGRLLRRLDTLSNCPLWGFLHWLLFLRRVVRSEGRLERWVRKHSRWVKGWKQMVYWRLCFGLWLLGIVRLRGLWAGRKRERNLSHCGWGLRMWGGRWRLRTMRRWLRGLWNFLLLLEDHSAEAIRVKRGEIHDAESEPLRLKAKDTFGKAHHVCLHRECMRWVVLLGSFDSPLPLYSHLHVYTAELRGLSQGEGTLRHNYQCIWSWWDLS